MLKQMIPIVIEESGRGKGPLISILVCSEKELFFSAKR